MSRSNAVMHAVGASFLCLASSFAARAADANDIADLKRAIEVLREENRALAKRVETLEAEKSESAPQQNAGAEHPPLAKQPATLEAEKVESAQQKEPVSSPPTVVLSTDQEKLEQRVKELEMAKTAQEDAVRFIVRDSFAKLGPKINEVIALGGVIEVVGSRTKDFSGQWLSEITLGAVDLELDIQTSEWVFGRIKIDYDTGTSVLFPTATGFNTGVDRFTLGLGYLTLGNTQKFPPYLTAGQVVLPFGTGTGHPVTDSLSVNSPLTIEVFETTANAVGVGLSFPTPELRPPTPPVIAPRVRPVAVTPLVSSISRALGYEPVPMRPKPPAPFTFPPPPPPFDVAVFFFDGQTSGGTAGGPRTHWNATAGFNTRGHCGRTYDELAKTFSTCPWGINFDVSYSTSVFDSQFLRGPSGYQSFLPQIGLVPGMSASLKSAFGPISLVAEWNGAIKSANFFNGLNQPVSIKPGAWQVSLGYQFDWNPWAWEIGQQGTYISVGYSQSSDLAGTTALLNGVETRVGFVPKSRLLLTAGEWVLDTVRLAIEYSLNKDYPVSQGGTGKTAPGYFVTLVYAF